MLTRFIYISIEAHRNEFDNKHDSSRTHESNSMQNDVLCERALCLLMVYGIPCTVIIAPIHDNNMPANQSAMSSVCQLLLNALRHVCF